MIEQSPGFQTSSCFAQVALTSSLKNLPVLLTLTAAEAQAKAVIAER